ncbi:MAG: hypothetical protein HWN68_07765 [Desulfobacterales bacterium]|nr:hypothetical protein [Desulfobacterales bacterium]
MVKVNIRRIFKKKPLLVIIMLAIVSVVLFSYIRPLRLTVLSVSKVEIDPQGWEDPNTGEWKGSFWIITMTTDMNDQAAGIKLANDEEEPGNTYAQSSDGSKTYADDTTQTGERVVPQSKITVRIDPEQPYYERPLEIQQGIYSPVTYSCKQSKMFPMVGFTQPSKDWMVTSLDFVHREWGTGSWELHTPFKVTVLKNGVKIGERTIDTIGGTQVYRIPEIGDEYIRVTDLGKLGTGYGEPQMGEILFFNKDYIFQADTESRSLITSPFPIGEATTISLPDSFATYWYGDSYWYIGLAEENNYALGSPAPIVDPFANNFGLYDEDWFGGWIEGDTEELYIRKPVVPVVFPGDKSSLPYQKQAFMSLMEYLDDRNIHRVSMPSWLDRMEITADDKMRLYMPFGAVSSLITIHISTELTDTFVWEPLVAKFEITDFPDFGDIADRESTSITVKCAEGEGSGTITFTKDPSDLPASIHPPAIGTGSMTPGETKGWNVEILNLGTDEDQSFSITATITNSLGTVTDTATATGTLLKKTGEETILTVKTIYQKDESAVTGIFITVEYAQDTKSSITNAQGQGTISFSLGSYEGSVKVTSGSTAVYQPQEVTVNVASGSQTSVTLELYKWEEEEAIDWLQYLPWVLLAGVIVITSGVLVKKRRSIWK